MTCELCHSIGGALLWQDEFCRVVLVGDAAGYPGYCRIILNRHVKEMTDLADSERAYLMRVVYKVETAIRDVMHPDKINLASLGNVVPHVHWHVIPRFADDRHFPHPIWGEPLREGIMHQVDPAKLQNAVKERLDQLCAECGSAP